MRPASHAAGDGSFGRSAGMAAGRAAMLLGVAVLLGLLLLNATDAEPSRVTTATTVGIDDTIPGDDGGGDIPTDTTQVSRPPGQVKVIVANATRTEGAAARITERLRLAGYDVLPPTDTGRQEATIVHFIPGYEPEAQVIAANLEVPPASVQPLPTPAPVSDLNEAHVLVLVGPELASPVTTTSSSAPASPGATTSTTA